jgi:Ca-activated chloride channel family protein
MNRSLRVLYRQLLCAALLLAALVAAPLLGAQPAAAQMPVDPWPPTDPHFPIEPPQPWPPAPVPPVVFPVIVELHQVNAVVDGPVASVTVTQIFRNDSSREIEGTYLFALPEDGAPSSLQMTIDGETVEGRLYDKDEARAIYEEIVRSRRDPALLEWLGRGLFQMSVFPIPAGTTRTVELTYEHPLALENGLYRLDVPLKAYVPGASAPENVAVNVELRNQPGLRAIYSPSHEVAVERTGNEGALVSFEGDGADTRSEFTLYFGSDKSAIGANLLSYKPRGEDGYFMLLVAPSVEAAAADVVARDIILVLDVSGSMKGEKIGQAQSAAHAIVEQLNPDDRFNLITFSTGVRLWQNEPQPVSARTRANAESWIDDIDATGATDINRALLEALGQTETGERARPAYILFLTDGLPTQGEIDPDRIVANAANNRPAERTVRLFTFGVGYDVNTDLLNTLSSEMGGRSSYVKPDQAIDEVIGNFYSQIGKPVLANVDLTLTGDTLVDEIYPFPLPDLFAGEQLVVVGRYRNGGDVDLRIAGDINGEAMTHVYPNQVLAEAGGEPFVARLWATRKIGALIQQIRRTGADPELVEAVVELSLQYGIVSPYTSYLVLEPGAGPEMPISQARAQSLAAPRDAAMQAGAAAMESAAAAPASGAAAVVASEARASLESAERVDEQSQVRFVAGKSFVQRGWVEGVEGQPMALWVDTGYSAESEPEIVEFGSERYFALAQDDNVAQWLSISPELILVLDNGTQVRITTVAP